MFVEDTVIIFGDLAVLTSSGAASRRGEVETTATALGSLVAELGLEISRIEEPGHLDGGDVLKVGRTAPCRSPRSTVRRWSTLAEAPF